MNYIINSSWAYTYHGPNQALRNRPCYGCRTLRPGGRRVWSVKVVAVVIGAANRQVNQFCDRVIFVGDLLADKEKLRAAVGEVV